MQPDTAHKTIKVTQCVLLAGGLGSRLGSLTESRPKPMLEVAGRPFLLHLIKEFSRFGFTEFLLLAGFRAEALSDYFYGEGRAFLPAGIDLKIVTEPEPLGTAGALRAAKSALNDIFFMSNGDSLFDCNFLKMTIPFNSDRVLGRMALRPMQDAERYGSVLVEDQKVVSFREKGSAHGSALINTGLYCLSRDILEHIPAGKKVSLETEIFPALAAQGRLEALVYPTSYFIDIGVLEDLEKARREFDAAVIRRPAVFFDRDVILKSCRDVHQPGGLVWMPGARESILAFNNAGWLVFVPGDQIDGDEPGRLYQAMAADLYAIGAHIDDLALRSPHRPVSGPDTALNQLINCWPADLKRSVMIGGKRAALEAALTAGLDGRLFTDGNLLDFIKTLPYLFTAVSLQ